MSRCFLVWLVFGFQALEEAIVSAQRRHIDLNHSNLKEMPKTTKDAESAPEDGQRSGSGFKRSPPPEGSFPAKKRPRKHRYSREERNLRRQELAASGLAY